MGAAETVCETNGAEEAVDRMGGIATTLVGVVVAAIGDVVDGVAAGAVE